MNVVGFVAAARLVRGYHGKIDDWIHNSLLICQYSRFISVVGGALVGMISRRVISEIVYDIHCFFALGLGCRLFRNTSVVAQVYYWTGCFIFFSHHLSTTFRDFLSPQMFDYAVFYLRG